VKGEKKGRRNEIPGSADDEKGVLRASKWGKKEWGWDRWGLQVGFRPYPMDEALARQKRAKTEGSKKAGKPAGQNPVARDVLQEETTEKFGGET